MRMVLTSLLVAGAPAGDVVGAVPGASRDAAVEEAALDEHAALAAVVVVVGGDVVDRLGGPVQFGAFAHNAVDHFATPALAGAGAALFVADFAVDNLLAYEAALEDHVAIDAVLMLVVQVAREARHTEGAVDFGLGVLVDFVVEHGVEGLVAAGGIVGAQVAHLLGLVSAVEVVAHDKARIVVGAIVVDRHRALRTS